MDIEGAFDNITVEAIMKQLATCNLKHNILAWIKCMLSNRSINFSHLGKVMKVEATRGTPQGGVLSPLLWIIVVNDLLWKLHSNGFNAIGYADDLQIGCRGKYLGTLSELTQTALEIVETWCVGVGLRINPTKSEIIVFTNKRNFTGYKNPVIFGNEIQRRTEVKYLGVILDSKLSWKAHIESRIKKCLRVFWTCRSAIGKSWGLSPKYILWIYEAIVKPMLSYAAFIWWQGCGTQTIKNKLNHLQRVASLCITGAMRTTPQAALDTLLNLPQLDVYIEAEASKTAYRMRNRVGGITVGRRNHSLVLRNLYRMEPILEGPSDRIAKSLFLFDKNFSTIYTNDLNEYCEQYNWAESAFYTDASVKRNGSGLAWFNASTGTSFKLSTGKAINVLQLELMAILWCLINILEKDITGRVVIFTYSLGAIKALENVEVKSTTVLDCRKLLQQITNNTIIRLVWIKSHSNIIGNEIVDGLARRAANDQTFGPEPFVPIQYSYVTGIVKEWLHKQAYMSWNGNIRCRETKKFVRKPDGKNTAKLIGLDKNNTRITVGLITGHAKVYAHLKKMGLRDEPDCRLCGLAPETTFHLIRECPILSSIRTNVLGHAGSDDTPDIYKIINFFKKACVSFARLREIFDR